VATGLIYNLRLTIYNLQTEGRKTFFTRQET